MRPQPTHLSLRIRHPDADLSEIGNKFGLPPKVIWTKGDARITPKGRNLGGLRDSSYCSVDFGPASEVDLGTKLEAALNIVRPFATDLKKLASTGGSIVFAIGWFLKEDTGERVEWNMLAQMAEAMIGFDFYVYVPDEADSDEADVI